VPQVPETAEGIDRLADHEANRRTLGAVSPGQKSRCLTLVRRRPGCLTFAPLASLWMRQDTTRPRSAAPRGAMQVTVSGNDVGKNDVAPLACLIWRGWMYQAGGWVPQSPMEGLTPASADASAAWRAAR
jgi:hypothetical protein